MPEPSLFTEQEAGKGRSTLGDPLVGLSEHGDVAALADDIDPALPRCSGVRVD
ncbi:hypothetical protein [Massilia sp. DWR3-1-1]|uniref:hypothetical protein n=1 Tax=Massilia sp. DWR3-1-1 TaxID=2804559 RepID=UPI003CF50C69